MTASGLSEGPETETGVTGRETAILPVVATEIRVRETGVREIGVTEIRAIEIEVTETGVTEIGVIEIESVIGIATEIEIEIEKGIGNEIVQETEIARVHERVHGTRTGTGMRSRRSPWVLRGAVEERCCLPGWPTPTAAVWLVAVAAVPPHRRH